MPAEIVFVGHGCFLNNESLSICSTYMKRAMLLRGSYRFLGNMTEKFVAEIYVLQFKMVVGIGVCKNG